MIAFHDLVPRKIKNHIPLSLKLKYGRAFRFSKKLRVIFLTKIIDKDKISKGEIPILTPDVEWNQKVWANLPEKKILGYKNVDIKRSEYLKNKILETKIKHDEQILEIGSNVGRNLNYLSEHGFTSLVGIEINKLAVEIMRKEFPKLRYARMLTGSVESMIKLLDTDSIALTFSMAVLMHINPRSHFIFKEIARVTKNFIITIELEDYYNPPSIFARNYQKVFEPFGFEQIRKSTVDKKIIVTNPVYTTRVFRKMK